MRKQISNLILLIIYYKKIVNLLKENDLINIKIFNFKNWHHGYGYCTAELYNEKVFIKFDTKLLLLKNDLLVYKLADNELKKHLVKIYDSIILDDLQIIIYEFLEGNEISQNIIIENPELIDKIISILLKVNSLNIIHRDIKLDNFFLVNGRIKIIDFTFANSLNKNLGFKELVLNPKNCAILEFLGDGYNTHPFYWNDIEAFKNILTLINNDIGLKYDVGTLNKYSTKTYSIKCPLAYITRRNAKIRIKNILKITHHHRVIIDYGEKLCE